MAETFKFTPFDGIRFPEDPKLEGVPRRTSESLLGQTGVAYALEIMEDTPSNADTRRRYTDRLRRQLTRTSRQAANLRSGFETVINNSHNERGRTVRNAAIFVDSKLFPPDEEEQPPLFTDEKFNALYQTDAFREHLDDFSAYMMVGNHRKRLLIEKQAERFFQNPGHLLQYVENVDMFLQSREETLSDEAINYRDFHRNLQKNLDILTDRPEDAGLAQTDLVAWMKLFVGDPRYSPLAEKLLSTWIASEDPEIVVGRMHQLSTAVYTQDDPKLIKTMLEITGLRTNILPFDSDAAIDYTLSPVYASRATRQQKTDIDDAEKFITGNFPELIRATVLQNQLAHLSQARSPKARERGESHIAHSAHTDITNLTEIIESRGFINDFKRKRLRLHPTRPDAEATSLPATSLRRWINEQTAEWNKTTKLGRSRRMTGEINLPGVSRIVKAPLPAVVEEVKTRLVELEPQSLTQPEHWRTLALLVPDTLDQRKLERLQESNRQLRYEIAEERLRGISLRGDKIVVTNPELISLGFQNIEINRQDDAYTLQMDVQGKTFGGLLSRDWLLTDSRYGARRKLPITGAFLEHVLLSHVHELLCMPMDEPQQDGDGPPKGFFSRRDHQRILPKIGQSPSDAQIIKARVEYGVDLNARNAARVAAGELYLITWVSAVARIDKSGVGPIISHAEKATDKLEEIMAA